MAIQGSYRINFTDPKNGSFVIEPYTVNGNVTPTSDVLHTKATRANTSLQLPGQYVPNYGELVHENLVHLLENFAGDTPPTEMIEGQLWYDTGDSYPIVNLSIDGVTVSGNHSAVFGGYITTGAILTAWYGPVSVLDNSYNSINFKVTTVMVTSENNTVITIVGTDGTATSLPNTAIGGFITPSQSSRIGRLKVATKIQNQLTWTDVVTVNCGLLPPVTEHLQNGDLWFDTGNMLLKLYLNNSWFAVTGNYLPLTGGTLSGPLQMGTNPVLFSGLVDTNDTLTNKLYVDSAIAAAVDPLQEETEQAIADLTGRVITIETILPDKVSKAGDNIRGTLTFGPNGSVSTLTAGIDMLNKPIINPSITWSAGDYLNAVGETHNAVDKNYVALALKQHLLDEIHGGKQFIIEQPDGTGKIVESLFFADVSDTLNWHVNNTTYGIGTSSNALVLSTGQWLGSAIEFRQMGNSSTTPLLSIGDSATRSYNSIYLFDGQPQPHFGGTQFAENDDTKAASKGFVAWAIDQSNIINAPITGLSFAYQEAFGPYNLTLQRPGGDLVVDINHSHRSDKIFHTYQPLVSWAGGRTDLVGNALGNPALANLEPMLNALNTYKAPTSGAVFIDAPVMGTTSGVTELMDSPSGFLPVQIPVSALPVGQLITITWPSTEISEETGLEVPILVSQRYNITGTTVVGTDPLDQKTFFNVTPPLPTGHDLTLHPMNVLVPLMDENNDSRNLMTRAAIERLIATSLQDLTLDGGTY